MNRVRVFPRITAGLAVVLLLYGCASQKQETRHLTILHTNDIHGQFIPTSRVDGSDTIAVGGFAALSHWVREERRTGGRVLLLDAGDVMTGNPICDLEYEGALGGGLVTMMNLVGYDGMVPGNHVFDQSASNARALARVASCPVLCSNLDRDGEPFTDRAYEIFELDGLNVGVIGVTYHPLSGTVPAPLLEGFRSADPAEAVGRIVRDIDSLTDVIIVLSHAGLEGDYEIARRVEGIDLIVGGHNHRALDTLHRAGGVLIAQAGSYLRHLGRIDLEIVDDRIAAHRSRLIPLRTDGIRPDTAVARLVAQFEGKIEAEYGEVIGELLTPWTLGGRESNVGQWLTDALCLRLGTDVAFMNRGGIRKAIPAGPVRRADILEMLPFDNSLVTFRCAGQQLLEIARQNVQPDADMLQLSGLTYTWRQGEDGPEVVGAEVNGIPVVEAREYDIACIDYVVIHHSARYFGFKVDEYTVLEEKLPAVVIDRLRKDSPVDAQLEERIRRVD